MSKVEKKTAEVSSLTQIDVLDFIWIVSLAAVTTLIITVLFSFCLKINLFS